jgi:DNA excision repair protein ERCC-4
MNFEPMNPSVTRSKPNLSSKQDFHIVLAVDTREQDSYGPLFRTPYVVQTLSEGDYSVCGLEDRIAIERKSLSDLVSSLTFQRTRFEKELSKAKSYDRFYVVCECSAEDILEGRYRSNAHPASIWESIHALAVRHNTPFLFLSNRETAARAVESILCKYACEFVKSAEAVSKAACQSRTA